MAIQDVLNEKFEDAVTASIVAKASGEKLFLYFWHYRGKGGYYYLSYQNDEEVDGSISFEGKAWDWPTTRN